MTADTATDFAALLFDTLGHTDTEFVSLGYEDTAGTFGSDRCCGRPRQAKLLRTTEQGLAQLRYRGTGPPFVKVGWRVLYRRSAIVAYLEENTATRSERR